MAFRLKHAGYHQNDGGGAFYFPENLGGGFTSPWSDIAGMQSHFPGAAYAPDVLELLNALPVGYQLQRNEKGFFAALPSFWGDTMDGYFFESQTYDNPADALAECYLHINQKNENETSTI